MLLSYRDATRTLLVSDSKCQHHAGSGTEKFMAWLRTLQRLGTASAEDLLLGTPVR